MGVQEVNINGTGKQDHSVIQNVGEKPKAQDLWAAIAFLINTAAFLGLAIFTYSTADWTIIDQMNKGGNPKDDLGNPFTGAGIASILVSFFVAFLITFIYLKLMQKHPEALIKFSFFLYMGVMALTTIICFALRQYGIGVINLIFLALTVFMWFGIRSQIPFLAALLSTVANVTRKYPALLTTVFIGDIVSLIWSAFSAGAFMSFYVKFGLIKQTASNGNVTYKQETTPAFIICMIYALFSSYWVMNVLRYLVHVCVCGVYATYYFLADNMPASPTVASIKRGLTTSFGSVCLGALLITIVQVIRTLIRVARNNSDNMAMYFLLCCLECIVSCLEGLLEFFNYYAFCQVAIYGKDYCTAGKDTWNLLKQRGLDVIINEILMDRVIAMGTLFVLVICFVIPLIIYSAAGEFDKGPWVWLWAIISMVLGAFIFENVGTVINAGIATTFVCLAEDPEALRHANPEFYDLLVQKYPQVAVGLHA